MVIIRYRQSQKLWVMSHAGKDDCLFFHTLRAAKKNLLTDKKFGLLKLGIRPVFSVVM